jgi:hypothetical protein
MSTAQSTATELFLALDKIGASSLTDDACCQLLAWLNYDRGESEAPIYKWALNRDIKIAQQRLDLFGGETPNVDLVVKFNQYRQELTQSDAKPAWFTDIEIKYGLDDSNKKTNGKNKKG